MNMNSSNNFCEFISLDDGDFYCIKCSRIIYSHDHEPPIMPCAKLIDKDPNCCSPEEVLYRFDICKKCDKFADNVCLECGCLVSSAMHFTNKLYWKNNSCPLDKWNKLS